MNKNEFLEKLREFIRTGELDEALTLMSQNIKEFDVLYINDVRMLQNKFSDASHEYTINTISKADYDVLEARICEEILKWADKMERPADANSNRQTGRILHKIPSTMPVQRESKCIVRIAYNDEMLLQGLKSDAETEIENVSLITEVMSVELIDNNETDTFKIRTCTDPDQIVINDDFTEWQFWVKPLKEGRYPLSLKVSAVELVEGKERKKNVVLEKEIFITNDLQTTVVQDFEKSNIQLDNTPKKESATAASSVFIAGATTVGVENAKVAQQNILLKTARAAVRPILAKMSVTAVAASIAGTVVVASAGYKVVEAVKQHREKEKLEKTINVSPTNTGYSDTTKIITSKDSVVGSTIDSAALKQIEPIASIEKQPIGNITLPTKPAIKPIEKLKEKSEATKTRVENKIDSEKNLNGISEKPIGKMQEKLKDAKINVENKIDENIASKTQTNGASFSAKSITETPNAATDENRIIDNNLLNWMITVDGGTFQMGSNDGNEDEKPTHSVTLGSFKISKYEITQKQWETIMGSNPSKFKGDNLPVENVSYEDVQEFLQKLNSKTGKNYRLPTEAEWEFAARGGINSKKYKFSGSNDLNDVAWNNLNSGNKTHTVDLKNTNELGIYDMTGNVWEWCNDWYDENYYKNSPARNPPGAVSGSYRVYRGGSWLNTPVNCRVALRNSSTPSGRYSHLGFRVVLSSR